MERLTRRDLAEDGQVLCNIKVGLCNENPDCNDSCLYGTCKWNKKALQKLKEHEDAEEQGLLLRLPCKVGDTVYTKCSWGIESGVVGSIEIIADRVFVNNIHGAMIGEAQNIFLAKEEAEQALARMEDGNE